jgi:hypothetical protein
MAFMPSASGAGPTSTLPPGHPGTDALDGALDALAAGLQPDDEFSDADLEAGNSGMGTPEVVESDDR